MVVLNAHDDLESRSCEKMDVIYIFGIHFLDTSLANNENFEDLVAFGCAGGLGSKKILWFRSTRSTRSMYSRLMYYLLSMRGDVSLTTNKDRPKDHYWVSVHRNRGHLEREVRGFMAGESERVVCIAC